MRILFLAFLIFIAADVAARELGGIQLKETMSTGDGIELSLNGAGIRSKLFFKIYIASLYLQNPSTSSEQVIEDQARKKIVMHFLYDVVGKEKLVSGWKEGFEANNSRETMEKLKEKIDQFNALFIAVKKGDEIELDYIPGKGTVVTIGGAEKGIIEGKEFNDALLKIWLGDEPVTDDLKKALLGKS